MAQQGTASDGTGQQRGGDEAGASACVDVDIGVTDGQGVGRAGHVGCEAHGVAERGRKRRGTGEREGGAGAWRLCALGEVWVLDAAARTSTREVRLAEVVAGRRLKRARRTETTSTSGRASQTQTTVVYSDGAPLRNPHVKKSVRFRRDIGLKKTPRWRSGRCGWVEQRLRHQLIHIGQGPEQGSRLHGHLMFS